MAKEQNQASNEYLCSPCYEPGTGFLCISVCSVTISGLSSTDYHLIITLSGLDSWRHPGCHPLMWLPTLLSTFLVFISSFPK